MVTAYRHGSGILSLKSAKRERLLKTLATKFTPPPTAAVVPLSKKVVPKSKRI